MGVTGSGKTFTMAHVIANLGRPTLVMAPNKTLAAQLFQELREFFPDNAVEFFISYYDYYQPEAYIPSTDTYIAKDAAINDDIDKMRHSATRSLFERNDVIIVASVSCIYGLGSPESYASLVVKVEAGEEISRDQFLRKLVDIQYGRNDVNLTRGHFRVRGDTVDILPSHERDQGIRVEFFGDEIDQIHIIDTLSGTSLRQVEDVAIYPGSHYVTDRRDMGTIVREILGDLGTRLRELKALGKHVEFQRLEQRVMQDIEMMEHLGWCSGIENYSRYLTGLPAGHPPPTLLDYFPKDALLILDESHITVPQLRGMFRGDQARKQVLIDFGFRLPSARDNRPLNFDEFMSRSQQLLYVSATPGPFELQSTDGKVTEQIIRPTGLIDPEIEVRPSKGQIDDLYQEICRATKLGGRVLITTLTKRMSEELTHYYAEMGVAIKYLHSDIDSLERAELLRDLRKGEYDVLVGINLLREGLDLPEVNLVAVLDADKEGFLRSRSSLIQIVGRAARNADSRVIFYAMGVTESMRQCMEETKRRREIQIQYNEDHDIVPKTVIKKMPMSLRAMYGLTTTEEEPKQSVGSALDQLKARGIKTKKELDAQIRKLTRNMHKAAAALEFEEAAQLRDEVNSLQDIMRSLPGQEDFDQ